MVHKGTEKQKNNREPQQVLWVYVPMILHAITITVLVRIATHLVTASVFVLLGIEDAVLERGPLPF